MKIIDISVPISSQIPTWPGDPPVIFTTLSSISKGDGSNLTQLTMSLHTGTHIDAPKHFFDHGKTTEQIPFEKLIGEVLVVGIDETVDVITESILRMHSQSDEIKKAKKILFKTKNSKFWHSYPAEFRTDFVGIDASAAAYLAALKPDLIGVDYLSVAPYDETDTPHQIMLEYEIVLLESIDLTEVLPGVYQLVCLPIKVANCEGAPARVILIEYSGS